MVDQPIRNMVITDTTDSTSRKICQKSLEAIDRDSAVEVSSFSRSMAEREALECS